MNNTELDNGWMRRMFDSIPQEYNCLNRVLTVGRDETWRQKTLDAIEAEDGTTILDICTGTGDLALKIASKFPNAKVYAVDFSPGMLVIAKERALQMGLQNIIFEENDCLYMEFPNTCFNYITVSFGFRNLSYSMMNLEGALKEIHRVLKNNGKLVIIETSQPANVLARNIFHFYAKNIVPLIGKLVSGHKEPYAYLGASIVKFFNQEKVIDLLGAQGFQIEMVQPYLFGMISLYVFQKKSRKE